MIFAKDVLKALHQGKQDMPLADIVRDAHFVPEPEGGPTSCARCSASTSISRSSPTSTGPCPAS